MMMKNVTLIKKAEEETTAGFRLNSSPLKYKIRNSFIVFINYSIVKV